MSHGIVLVVKSWTSHPRSTSLPKLQSRLRVNSATLGPSIRILMRQSNTSTGKHDLQSDFIFPITEKPRSQHAGDSGRISVISTSIRIFFSNITTTPRKTELK